MDPSVPDVETYVFNLNADWKEFYGDDFEENPRRMPEPLVRPLYVGYFIDADHVGNVITRLLHSGILLFFNNALIKPFRERQNTVESSMFDSELGAPRIERGMILEIRIKLKMFGVPLDGSENVFCDNNEVVKNTSIHESTFSKKHDTINYHCVLEADESGIMRIGKKDTATKLSNP